MSVWTELTVALVERALPTDLATAYAAWLLAHPSKAGRLAELVVETVATVRQAVASNPACLLDDALTTVPTAGFRHALNSVIFNLGMEMGTSFVPEVYTLVVRADIWLRMVANGAINPVGVAAGTPTYEPPASCPGTLGAEHLP